MSPVEKDGHTYLYVYVHPDKTIFDEGMVVGRRYVSGKLKVQQRAVSAMVAAIRDDWARGPDDPLPDGSNTLLVVRSSVLPQ